MTREQLVRIAEIFEEQAASVLECETIDGVWPDDAQEAKDYHDECVELSRALRSELA